LAILSRKMENRNSVNNSGIGILCSKNSNERLAVPAVAGFLVLSVSFSRSYPPHILNSAPSNHLL